MGTFVQDLAVDFDRILQTVPLQTKEVGWGLPHSGLF